LKGKERRIFLGWSCTVCNSLKKREGGWRGNGDILYKERRGEERKGKERKYICMCIRKE
jgi:hypothetical protein